MAPGIAAESAAGEKSPEAHTLSKDSEKASDLTEHGDVDSEGNIVYLDANEEPRLSTKTWVALAAMFFLHFVQVMSLQGPPAVLSFIGADLNASASQTWVPNALSLVQAVLGPIISSASDTFQARKIIIVASCVTSFIGCAIAPGSQGIARLLGATVLIGVGFAAAPLAYCVPSEVVPRKWYPFVQGLMNVAVACSAVASPLTIGKLTTDEEGGWRKFYWIQMALWGASAFGIMFGYHPPKRHTRLDHLSVWQKLKHLDLVGFVLLSAGLTLFLVGLGLGGGLYTWGSSHVLGTLISGMAVLIAFGVYEWKGTDTGILNHEIFKGGKERGRTFALCAALIFIEGILVFSFSIFYPVLTGALFETDAFKIAVRGQPFWIAAVVSSAIFGYVSSKFRTIRTPMFCGFLLYTGATIGFATIEPGDSTNALVFAGMAGIGFSAPLVLIIATAQLAVPHHLIATAVSVLTSARSIAATVFTASYSSAVNNRLSRLVPRHVAPAVIAAGLSSSSVPVFIKGLTTHNQTLIQTIPGVTPMIISAGRAAFQQAEADSVRVVYEIAAPFGALACVLVLFLGSMSTVMDYKVDAPLEDLRGKHEREGKAAV